MVEGSIQLRFETENLTGDESRILQMRGIDRISQLSSYELLLETDEYGTLVQDELLLKAASIAFLSDSGEELHRIHGIVTHFRDQVDADAQFPRVRLTIAPRLYVAGQFETLDIFLDSGVPDVVRACLERCGLGDDDFELALTGQYEPREFIVQYKETDLSFISRLCEHIGIHFHFDDDGKAIFGDGNAGFAEVSRMAQVPFIPRTNEGHGLERVSSLEIITRNAPKKYVVRDYNWRNPGVDLLGEADVLADGVGQVVEYGGHFKTPGEATNLARIRAQELLAARTTYVGRSYVPNFRAGATYELLGHPMGDTPFLLTEVIHEYRVGAGYSNEFRSIHKDTVFRPARITPKPRVSGAVTGIVDAASGTEFGEIDEQGRYRVRFMYDTAERGQGQASRAVRMAQPSAGGSQGFHFPLRAGVEVILTCIDGDPDRPIITGAVPNPQSVSPVSSGNANHNVIRTAQNQIDIDDQDPRVKITAGAFDTMLQLGSPNEPNEGYMLKTANDGVATAGKLFGVGTKVYSAFSTYNASFANRNIIQEAGPPSPIKGFGKFVHFATAAADFATGALEATQAVVDFGKTITSHEAEKAQKKVEEAQKALLGDEEYDESKATVPVTGSNGETVYVQGETEEQWKKRRAQERSDEQLAEAYHRGLMGDADGAAAAAAAAEQLAYAENEQKAADETAKAWKDASESVERATAPYTAAIGLASQGLQQVGKAVEAVKDAKGIKNALGELWGDIKRVGRQVGEVKAVASANFYVTRSKMVSVGRKAYWPRDVMEPLNFQGSSNSAVVAGGTSASLFGKSSAQVWGQSVNVHGGTRARFAANVQAELAASNVYLSSVKKLDAHSDGTVQIVADKTSTFLSKDTTKIESKEKDVQVKAKTKYVLDGGDKIEAKAKQVKWEATEKSFVTEVKADYWVKAKQDVKLNADRNGMLHGKQKASAKSDKGGIEASTSVTKVWQQGTKLELKSSEAKLKSTKLAIDGASVKIKGSQVSVNGSKVLLG